MTISVEKDVKIKNKYGLHARPSASLVQLANKFASEIFLLKDGVEVNAKSIIGVMTLAASFGSKVRVKACGEDAKEAVKNIVKLINNKFGEE